MWDQPRKLTEVMYSDAISGTFSELEVVQLRHGAKYSGEVTSARKSCEIYTPAQNEG